MAKKKNKLSENEWYAVKLYARSPMAYFALADGQGVRPAIFGSRKAAQEYAKAMTNPNGEQPRRRDISVVRVAVVQQ